MSYRSQQATDDEIGLAVIAVVSVMPAPRGMDSTMLANGYLSALRGFPAWAINDAVQGFLSGRFAADFSTKFCPTPPDLAAMVRKVMAAGQAMRTVGNPGPASRKYAFRSPSSRCIERGIYRDEAERLVREGMYDAGCIWLPGGYDDRPEYGDLFEPDANWAEPRRIMTAEEVREEEAKPKPSAFRLSADERRAAADFMSDWFQRTPPRERGGFWAQDCDAAVRNWLANYRAKHSRSDAA